MTLQPTLRAFVRRNGKDAEPSDEPDVEYLLGFESDRIVRLPVKTYIRRLWLAFQSSMKTLPKFYFDPVVLRLSKEIESWVADFVKDEDMRAAELGKDPVVLDDTTTPKKLRSAFMEETAHTILVTRDWGEYLWGNRTFCKVPLANEKREPGDDEAPVWPRDQERITMAVRHWLAARLQDRLQDRLRQIRAPKKVPRIECPEDPAERRKAIFKVFPDVQLYNSDEEAEGEADQVAAQHQATEKAAIKVTQSQSEVSQFEAEVVQAQGEVVIGAQEEAVIQSQEEVEAVQTQEEAAQPQNVGTKPPRLSVRRRKLPSAPASVVLRSRTKAVQSHPLSRRRATASAPAGEVLERREVSKLRAAGAQPLRPLENIKTPSAPADEVIQSRGEATQSQQAEVHPPDPLAGGGCSPGSKPLRPQRKVSLSPEVELQPPSRPERIRRTFSTPANETLLLGTKVTQPVEAEVQLRQPPDRRRKTPSAPASEAIQPRQDSVQSQAAKSQTREQLSQLQDTEKQPSLLPARKRRTPSVPASNYEPDVSNNAALSSLQSCWQMRQERVSDIDARASQSNVAVPGVQPRHGVQHHTEVQPFQSSPQLMKHPQPNSAGAGADPDASPPLKRSRGVKYVKPSRSAVKARKRSINAPATPSSSRSVTQQRLERRNTSPREPSPAPSVGDVDRNHSRNFFDSAPTFTSSVQTIIRQRPGEYYDPTCDMLLPATTQPSTQARTLHLCQCGHSLDADPDINFFQKDGRDWGRDCYHCRHMKPRPSPCRCHTCGQKSALEVQEYTTLSHPNHRHLIRETRQPPPHTTPEQLPEPSPKNKAPAGPSHNRASELTTPDMHMPRTSAWDGNRVMRRHDQPFHAAIEKILDIEIDFSRFADPAADELPGNH